MEQPLALDPRVEHPRVDPPCAALVGGPRDLAGELLLARIRGHADDLTRLDVGSVADDEVGQPPGEVGVVTHGLEPSRARMAPCG